MFDYAVKFIKRKRVGMYLWKITQMKKKVRKESVKKDCEQNHSS